MKNFHLTAKSLDRWTFLPSCTISRSTPNRGPPVPETPCDFVDRNRTATASGISAPKCTESAAHTCQADESISPLAPARILGSGVALHVGSAAQEYCKAKSKAMIATMARYGLCQSRPDRCLGASITLSTPPYSFSPC